MDLVLSEHNYCFRGNVKTESSPLHAVKKEFVIEIKREPEYFMTIENHSVQIKREPDSTEEDKKPVICTQPMVKNADGKLMVSLLKVSFFL